MNTLKKLSLTKCELQKRFIFTSKLTTQLGLILTSKGDHLLFLLLLTKA